MIYRYNITEVERKLQSMGFQLTECGKFYNTRMWEVRKAGELVGRYTLAGLIAKFM